MCQGQFLTCKFYHVTEYSHIPGFFEVTDWTIAYCGYGLAKKYSKCLDVYFKCLFMLKFEEAPAERKQEIKKEKHLNRSFVHIA